MLNADGLNAQTPRRIRHDLPESTIRLLPHAQNYISKPQKFWESVLWSDETRLTFWASGSVFVWRRKNEADAEKNTLPTLKHGGGLAMIWDSLASLMETCSVWRARWIQWSIRKSYVRKLKLGLHWTFQQDNHPKHKVHQGLDLEKVLEDSRVAVWLEPRRTSLVGLQTQDY